MLYKSKIPARPFHWEPTGCQALIKTWQAGLLFRAAYRYRYSAGYGLGNLGSCSSGGSLFLLGLVGFGGCFRSSGSGSRGFSCLGSRGWFGGFCFGRLRLGRFGLGGRGRRGLCLNGLGFSWSSSLSRLGLGSGSLSWLGRLSWLGLGSYRISLAQDQVRRDAASPAR